tara:strand:+ start:960 stop:1736 length:777 start_codon:yes stop_codon:yes gene_type:complete
MKIYQIVENIPTPVTKKDAALKKQAKHLKMKSMLAPGPLDQMVGANKAYMDKMDQTQKDADKLSKAAGIDPDYTKNAVANTIKNAKPNAKLRAKFGKKTTENVTDLNQLASSAQQGLQKVKQGDMRGALDNMEQIANGLAKLDIGTKMHNFMAKILSAYEQQVANFPEDPDTPKLQKVIDQIQAQMPTMQKQAAQSKQYAKMARNKEVDAFGGLGETTTAGAIATSMGNGNGFANGGPGTIKRAGYTKSKKVKNSKKT